MTRRVIRSRAPSGCKEKIPCGRLHPLTGSVRGAFPKEEDDEV